MTREDYFMCLDGYLRKLTDEEREEAIQYYQDYFDAAGPDNEQDVINKLGTPKELAESILQSEKNGEFTENGYENADAKKNVPVKREETNYNYNNFGNIGNNGATTSGTSQKKDDTSLVIAIILLVVLSPVLLGIASGLIGLVVGFIIGGIALILGGVSGIVGSFFVLFETPGFGIMLMGLSLIVGAVGLFLIFLFAVICKYLIPFLISSGKKLWNAITGKKEVA